MLTCWYITEEGQVVDLPTVVVDGVCTARVLRHTVTRTVGGDTHYMRTLWRAEGAPVTEAALAAAVAEASSDPIQLEPERTGGSGSGGFGGGLSREEADGLYAAKTHTHTQAQVTGLSTALAGKAEVDHNHDDRYAPLEPAG